MGQPRRLLAHRSSGERLLRDLPLIVPALLVADPCVESVELVGSRARGDATPISDWDFYIRTTDFDAVAGNLPDLVADLEPLGQFWDPLSEEWCYILMFPGPFAVDLIFDDPHAKEQPWTVTTETLPEIDTHFWNWIWWLTTKDQRGKADLVRDELAKMEWFLLGPLGETLEEPEIASAVAAFRAAVPARSELGTDVLSGLRRLGYVV